MLRTFAPPRRGAVLRPLLGSALAMAFVVVPSLGAISCRARADAPAVHSSSPSARPMPDSSSSADAGAPQPAAVVPFTRVYQDAQSAFGEPVELVVRSDAEWQRAWLAAHPNRAGGAPPTPAIDFAADQAIVVSAGTQPSGGGAVRVDSVRAGAAGGTEVVYTVSRPGAGCMSTQQITAPVEVVRFARRPGEVRFVRHDRATPC